MTDSKEDPATATVASNQEEGKKDSGAEEKSDLWVHFAVTVIIYIILF